MKKKKAKKAGRPKGSKVLRKNEIQLICCKCRKRRTVRVNKPKIYTEAIRKTWKCLSCSSLRKCKRLHKRKKKD